MENQKTIIIIIDDGLGGTLENLAESMKALAESIKGFDKVIVHSDLQATAALHPALAAEILQPPKLEIPEMGVIKNYNPKFEKNNSNKDYKRKSRKLFQ